MYDLDSLPPPLRYQKAGSFMLLTYHISETYIYKTRKK